MPHVDAIIPFYQKQPGILRRALDSVRAQVLPPGVTLRVIVVDDGSPVSANEDVTGLVFEPPLSLVVVQQPNGGVAAARDTGLRHTGAATDYVAFLDSDDSWAPEHIANAVAALSRGYDYYFADHGRSDHHASHFAEIGFPPANAPGGAVTPLGDALVALDKAFYFSHSLRRFTAQISTVVYRRSAHPDASFRHALKMSGEDRLFMLDVVAKSGKVCCSLKPEVTCGAGVNIYYSTFGWNDEGHIRRYMSDILADYALKDALPLPPDDAAYVNGRIRDFRRAFAFFTVRWFLKTRRAWTPQLKDLVRRDPAFACWYPLALLYVASASPLGLYRPK